MLTLISSSLLIFVGLALAVPEVSQNYSICSWARLRAGIIRDTIYLDGGLLWWQTAFVDGATPVVSSDGGVSGDMYRLNLSQPFDLSTTNLSALLEPMAKAGGAGNNIAPNYVDGTMFTNDDELYMYGGLPRLTNATTSQSNDVVLGYEAFQYGPQRDSWSPGFYQGSLSQSVNRYITNGAGASAPSENLGFYFSGMHASDWGEIHYEDSSASTPANTMIQVDMATMREEKWTNLTLPDEITPRANAELIWIPVAERGVLVAIGGVTEPEEIFPTGLNDTQRSHSESISPSFMTSIPIYDIASQKWYVQNVSGSDAPPQLTQFCSVLAVEEDASTYNIYIYGGYNGLDASDGPSDDVWVLSLPSFVWTRVYEGTESHGRSGHHCIAPYPDKMVVIGGVHQNQAQCVEGGYLQVFDLNKLEFVNVYNPEQWEKYKQPSKIGTSNHRRTKRQLQWSSPELENLFSTKYPREIQQYYPYKSSNNNSEASSSESGSSTNTVAIAVGVSIGVLIMTITVALVLLLRRRGMLRSGSTESSRTKRSRISQWIMGTRYSPSHGKSFNDDSVSELSPEVAHQYSNASALSSSETSSTPIIAPQRPLRAPQEMAAVDRPHPPFELATPYNNQSHPRTSTAIDYAYNAKQGHSSRSTSSEYGRLPTQTNQAPTPYDDIVREARASVDLADADRVSEASTSAWPLPATRPTWLRSGSTSSNNAEATEHLLAPPAPTIPALPQQYRSLSYNNTPDRLRPVLQDTRISDISSSDPSTQSTQDSSISSMVSPVKDSQNDGWEEQTSSRRHPDSNPINTQKRRLMDAISPITPDDPGRSPWHQTGGLENQPRRSSEKEGKENWWTKS